MAEEGNSGRIRAWSLSVPAAANRVQVVLIHPRRGENVGAAARAMKNFGLARLVLVAPGPFDPALARAVAKGAEELFDRRREFPDLAAALRETRLAVGWTARQPGHRAPPLAPRAAMPEIVRALGSGEVSLVFGPEWRGLADAEIDCCQLLVSIPTAPEQPSLNLAQAVVVAGYELWLALAEPPGASGERLPAAAGELAGLFAHLEEVLNETKFLPALGHPAVTRTLRDFVLRAAPDSREVAIARGIFRNLLYYLRKARG